MKPQRFRKKPVEIEAMRWFSDRGVYKGSAPILWVQDNGGQYRLDPSQDCWYIVTLEGEMRVADGDWVIRGLQGEFYPCKPSIFEATYKAAT